MNVDLYAQLHGLTHTIATHHSNRPSPQINVDSERERDIQADADQFVEEEMRNFQSGGLETAEIHSARMRQQIVNVLRKYYEIQGRGYEVISEAVQAAGETMPEISQENIRKVREIKDVDEEGGTIYKLLGYSEQTLSKFYAILNNICQQGQYAKARDGLYFMISIYRLKTEYWIGLGRCENQLQRYDKAEEAYVEACKLNPRNPLCYQGCLNAYKMQNKFAEAEALCEEGIAFAKENPGTAWATQLTEVLSEAQLELKAHIKEEI